MVVGFNHNFRYKNEMFHVQTEDGGLKSPNIITLLYRGGTILASKKTSYADITKTTNLDRVVEELMKEQHKEMLRRLKDGEFDAVIEDRRPGARSQATSAEPAASPPPAADPIPQSAPTPALPQAAAPSPTPSTTASVPAATDESVMDIEKKPSEKPAAEQGLDDIILSYLVGDD